MATKLRSTKASDSPEISMVETNSDSTFEFEFLCGYVDSDGVKHTTFTLREMTGKDEEAISRSDVKGNVPRAISVLLARTCTSIGSLTPKSVGGYKAWENIIKDLYVGDQDQMLISLRKISWGDEVEVSHKCPNCGRELKTSLSIDELPTKPFSGVRELEFSLPRGFKDKKGVVHKEGTLRLPKGIDREILIPVAKNNKAKADTVMLTRVCKFNDMTVDEDIISSLSMVDREYLIKLLQENLFGIIPNIDISCPDCGVEFTASLNATNFI